MGGAGAPTASGLVQYWGSGIKNRRERRSKSSYLVASRAISFTMSSARAPRSADIR